ncbi:MAG: hypothetical protein LBI42_00595 [Chitinispirillales bacterium]|jgi:23S rRNA (uracil1939-C5)-methyltransferase|nr:hypothetical protein [Chitinispirillales bacterium]
MSKVKSIRIEKMAYGGFGLGRGEDGIVLISGVIPGELVEYEPRAMPGGVRKGLLTRVIEKSSFRRDPPCEHAGECGGCDWLHMSYDEQVRRKKEVFMDCINRIGKIESKNDIEMFTANEFGYRIRAQIKIDHQNGCAGFYRKKTNNAVKIDKCPLLTNEINELLTKLNSGKNPLPAGVSSVKVLSGKKIASSPLLQNLTNAETEITAANRKFLAHGASFFQSNRFLHEKLGRWAQDFISGESCMDLYGGIGFFSIMLADIFSNGILVENDAKQVLAAKHNFHINGISNFKAVEADVEKPGSLERVVKKARPHCVIVDPPRPGLVKTTRKWLLDTAAPVILYVSCNPSTFARDAGELVRGGYHIAHWTLFDLYPNTHHIESATVFVKTTQK